MRFLQHAFSQPFLLTVSIAAIWHSSWSFATQFAGSEPAFSWDNAVHWFAWFMPGFLLAFSIDIGLLSIAHSIRRGDGTVAKLFAFAVLCIAMAYAQFLYLSAHMPALPLGAGVREEWKPGVQWLRDVSIIALPALLPVSMILYAFSDARMPAWLKMRLQGRKPVRAATNATVVRERTAEHTVRATERVMVEQPMQPLLDAKMQSQDANADAILAPEMFTTNCQHCGWTKAGYATPRAAINALTAHQRRCEVLHSVDANNES